MRMNNRVVSFFSELLYIMIVLRFYPPNGGVHVRGGFNVEPNYTSDAANAKAADTTRGDSRFACNECWAGN